MPFSPSQRVATVVCLLLSLASPAFTESQTGLSMYIDRHMAQVWPWRDDARFDAFAIVTDMTEKLRHTDAYGNEIATLMTDSFEGFPLLVLTDEDGDGWADFYVYYDERREDTTLEFGAYYTEPGDVMPFWLVFNRGPSFNMPDEGDPVVYWTNYQFVDRNRDGRFDTRAINSVDYDGDGQGSATDVLWLYDDDFDGGLDRGEHIVDGVSHDIPILDSVFQTKRRGEDTYDDKFRVGDPIGELADLIAADIHKAMAEGDRPENQPSIPYFPGYSFSAQVDDLEGWQDYQIGDLRLRLPAGDEWSIEYGEEQLQMIGGRRFDDTGALLTADAIIVAKDVISDSIFGDWIAGELATRNREWEIWNMHTDRDNYSLGDVQMGDTVIAGNTFYFLRHFFLYDPPLDNGIRRLRQELHLVFRPDFAENNLFYKLFLMRYCLQEHFDNDRLDVSYLRQALGQVSF